MRICAISRKAAVAVWISMSATVSHAKMVRLVEILLPQTFTKSTNMSATVHTGGKANTANCRFHRVCRARTILPSQKHAPMGHAGKHCGAVTTAMSTHNAYTLALDSLTANASLVPLELANCAPTTTNVHQIRARMAVSVVPVCYRVQLQVCAGQLTMFGISHGFLP